MHELAVCQSLLAEAERVARNHGAARVTRLVLTIGPLSGVEAPLLERAFTVARAGTMADGAELEISLAPVVVWCPECDRESIVATNALVCGGCGDWRMQLRSGDELMLRQVGIDDAAEVEAGPVAGNNSMEETDV